MTSSIAAMFYASEYSTKPPMTTAPLLVAYRDGVRRIDEEERAQAALRNQRMERERAIELEPRTSQFRGPFKDYCKPLAPYCVSADGMRIYGRVPTTHKQHTLPR